MLPAEVMGMDILLTMKAEIGIFQEYLLSIILMTAEAIF